jgi:transcriptional regulator with XRE-family HTH domain
MTGSLGGKAQLTQPPPREVGLKWTLLGDALPEHFSVYSRFMSDGTPLARLLGEAFRASGLTRARLAQLAGITGRGVGNILAGEDSNGRPAPGLPRTVGRIALALGVTAEQLRSVGRADAAERLEVFESGPAGWADPVRFLRALRTLFDNDRDFMHYVRSVSGCAPAAEGERIGSA